VVAFTVVASIAAQSVKPMVYSRPVLSGVLWVVAENLPITVYRLVKLHLSGLALGLLTVLLAAILVKRSWRSAHMVSLLNALLQLLLGG
jgi:hypothetical protein